jgi:hypothetical protein
MDETALLHIGLAAAGIGAGFVNTMAGGGSMLTLPALMLLGLPADQANGTNRLSVVSQSLTGALAYRKAGKLDEQAIAPMLIPAIAGALAGAAVASQVPEGVLKIVLLSTMIAMAVITLVFPAAIGAGEGGEPRRLSRSPAGIAGMVGAGLYAGFIQAGVGFILIAVIGGVLRYDIVAANALKLICTLVFGIVALAVFAVAGQVVWLTALLLAVYTTAGAQLGVRFALRVPARVIRWIVFVAVIASCVAAYLKG